MNQELGHWFLCELVPQLNNIVVVLARTKSHQELPGCPDRLVRVRLGNFSLKGVSAYLEKRLNRLPLPDGLFERIYQLSGGHPQAVSLAADLALQHGLDEPDLLRVFDDLPTSRREQTRALVDRIITAIEDKDVQKALEVGNVVRRFDSDLLRHLMAETEAEDETTLIRYQDIITKLEVYSFTECHSGYYKFHDFIRREMEQRLEKNDPARYEELHRRAASYYVHCLTAYEEKLRDATPYLRWYRYEDPEWQAIMAEWLYHLAHTRDRTTARLTLARVYFDAFWWWGCYLGFPFCERLLIEWGQTQTLPEDQEWLRLLRKFHDSYPTGYEKRGKGDWLQVEMALHRVRQLGGFGRNISELADDDRSHLRAITDLFLAEARRYRRVDDEKADQYYQEAYNLFVQADDRWNMSWTLFHLADLHMERGQSDKALELCQRSLSLARAPDIQDYEVIANDYRVRADVSWQQSDLCSAFQNYARAIFYSYAFQGLPPPPDFYTWAFYREMMDRTLARLRSLWESCQKAEAINACTYLHDFWTPYWELVGRPSVVPTIETLLAESRLEDLRAYLFPSEPREEELEFIGSDYVDQVNYLVQEMVNRIEANN